MNILLGLWPSKISVTKFNEYCQYYNIDNFSERRDVLLDLNKREYSLQERLKVKYKIIPFFINKNL